MNAIHRFVALGLAWATACTCQDASAPRQPPAAADPVAAAPAAPEPEAKAAPAIPELTAEDIRLIEADPKTLSPEDRRLRAYALRRKIMQNPDSAAARTLEDLRRAHEAGELQAPGGTPTFEARSANAPPSSGTPPAGVRP